MPFIYKYKTSTLPLFVKPRDIINLAVQNVFYKQFYVESAFTYNPGSTIKTWMEKNYTRPDDLFTFPSSLALTSVDRPRPKSI